MKELICTVCPRGCRLSIDEETLEVNGNFCERGAVYGKNEVTAPKRTVTGSVAVVGGVHSRLAVRTDRAIPKEKMFEIMKELHRFTAYSPVKRGEILIENVCDTDANIIASRDM